MAPLASAMRKFACLSILTAALVAWTVGPWPIAAAGQPEQVGSPSLFGSYMAGRVARGDRDAGTAARYYGSALQRDPDSDVLLEAAHMLEAADGNWPRAFDLAEHLIGNDPSHRMARYVLGAKALKEGRYADAEQHFASAKRGPVSDLTVALVRAWLLAGDGRSEAALAMLDTLSESDWSQLYQRYHRALLTDVVGRADLAAESFASAFENNERMLRIAEGYARHAAHRGDRKRALEILRAHLGDGPGHPLTRALLEEIERGGEVERLVGNAEEGVAEVLYGIGDVLTSEGGVELGTVYLQLAHYLRPDFPLAQVALGEVFESNKRHDAAIAVYDTFAPSSPLWLNVRMRKAFSLNALDRVDEAKLLLEELAAEFPHETRPLDALGNIMRSRERYPEAEEAYSRAIALVKTPQREHWSLYYSRGVAHERMKDWPKAEVDLKRALKLNPDQPLVLNYLGYSWVDQGRNLKQAMAYIRKAVKLKPDDGYFIDSLGWAYYRLGNFEQATTHLERAVELRPEDPVINDHLGDAYWRVGRKLEARFQWTQALTLNPEPEEVDKIKKKLAEGLDVDRKEASAQVRAKADN